LLVIWFNPWIGISALVGKKKGSIDISNNPPPMPTTAVMMEVPKLIKPKMNVSMTSSS
jgi:hypothetical protein